jgi:hypothetical protein
MTQTLKKLRPLFLSLLIFTLVAGGTPITESFAKWGRYPSVARKKKNKRYRRHSRAWWRRHRARLRARRERAERRRQTAQLVTRKDNTFIPAGTASNTRPVENSGVNSAVAVSAPRLPFDLQLPSSWVAGRRGPNGEQTFVVNSPDGKAAGTAVLAPINVTAAEAAAATQGSRVKFVGGAPIAALRRTVIDKMVAQGGWVVNDVVREMNGRRVFIVTAQTGAPGEPSKSWSFYFTELDGRLYSLATSAPVEFAAPVAAGSEQVMASLRKASTRNLASQ